MATVRQALSGSALDGATLLTKNPDGTWTALDAGSVPSVAELAKALCSDGKCCINFGHTSLGTHGRDSFLREMPLVLEGCPDAACGKDAYLVANIFRKTQGRTDALKAAGNVVDDGASDHGRLVTIGRARFSNTAARVATSVPVTGRVARLAAALSAAREASADVFGALGREDLAPRRCAEAARGLSLGLLEPLFGPDDAVPDPEGWCECVLDGPILDGKDEAAEWLRLARYCVVVWDQCLKGSGVSLCGIDPEALLDEGGLARTVARECGAEALIRAVLVDGVAAEDALGRPDWQRRL